MSWPVPRSCSELTLTPDDARLMTLRAQGMIGTDGRRGGVAACCRRLGAVQLDTISVLPGRTSWSPTRGSAPCPAPRSSARTGVRGQPPSVRVLVACRLRAAHRGVAVLRVPAARASAPAGSAGMRTTRQVCDEVLARLRAEGPLTTTELGGAKNGGAWWDWSDTKIAVEWLLDTGEVICARRTGWRRVYDLPERVLPARSAGRRPDRRGVRHPPGRRRRPGAGRRHQVGPDRLPPAAGTSVMAAMGRMRQPTTRRSPRG